MVTHQWLVWFIVFYDSCKRLLLISHQHVLTVLLTCWVKTLYVSCHRRACLGMAASRVLGWSLDVFDTDPWRYAGQADHCSSTAQQTASRAAACYGCVCCWESFVEMVGEYLPHVQSSKSGWMVVSNGLNTIVPLRAPSTMDFVTKAIEKNRKLMG